MLKLKGFLVLGCLLAVAVIFLDMCVATSTNPVVVGITRDGVATNYYFWNSIIAFITGFSAFSIFLVFIFVAWKVFILEKES